MDEIKYLSIKKAAEVTGLSEFFIRKGVRNGTIPAIRTGWKYMINMEGFWRYLKTIENKKD